MHRLHLGPTGITARETDILRLLADGKTTKEIATALKLSCETVASHRKHLCKKIGIHSTAELIAYACNCGRVP
jgi:DNA-binding CsgD family transcriptional regulator